MEYPIRVLEQCSRADSRLLRGYIDLLAYRHINLKLFSFLVVPPNVKRIMPTLAWQGYVAVDDVRWTRTIRRWVWQRPEHDPGLGAIVAPV